MVAAPAPGLALKRQPVVVRVQLSAAATERLLLAERLLALVPRSRHPAVLYGVELLVDAALLSGCWLAAYAVRFGGVQLPEGGPALPFFFAAAVGTAAWLLVLLSPRSVWRDDEPSAAPSADGAS